MNTVENGKGDQPRNNWGTHWYLGYESIDWHGQKRGRALTPSSEQTPSANYQQHLARSSRAATALPARTEQEQQISMSRLEVPQALDLRRGITNPSSDPG
jgi:hypothetical protein